MEIFISVNCMFFHIREVCVMAICLEYVDLDLSWPSALTYYVNIDFATTLT